MICRLQSPQPLPEATKHPLTVETLRDCGVVVDNSEPNRWRVEPGPIGALDVQVEPDLSNAAAFLAAALVSDGSVRVPEALVPFVGSEILAPAR